MFLTFQDVTIIYSALRFSVHCALDMVSDFGPDQRRFSVERVFSSRPAIVASYVGFEFCPSSPGPGGAFGRGKEKERKKALHPGDAGSHQQREER